LLHLKRLHFYEARLSAYEAFCGIAAKYEAHLMMHEAAQRAMKRSQSASFRHFWGKKKWRRGRDQFCDKQNLCVSNAD
jgi:hypothetical protein